MDSALALAARGRAVKAVCRSLGVARSHIQRLKTRPDSCTDGRRGRTPEVDRQLLADIRAQITELPSYGYRRACALVNRKRPNGAPRVNAKRVYRVMAGNGLLLPRAPRRRQSSRRHEGTVAVAQSDLRKSSLKRGRSR